MSGRQRTLFQTWGSSVSRSVDAPGLNSGTERPQSPGNSRSCCPAPAAEAQPDSDDDVFLVAAFEAEQQLGLEDGGFCASTGTLWIYPTNYPVRDYQLQIAQTALFCNTLVCLPTGLGKTFVAAVVMYNFYRWFPSGKVVFMAPTKPLVAQQIEACYRVMGIPQLHMAEMTGSTQASTRKEIWHKKRVLFLTPQVMVNDLSRGACPAAEIKCLVVDEAHKALGNYAYCQVVRELVKYTNNFRVLALSATPGSDVKAVQQVITNLLIGKIELRSEDSPDILPYSHERRVEKLVVPLGEELTAIQNTYIQILEAFTSPLIQKNVLMSRDILSFTKYQLILARDQFRKNPSSDIMGIQQGIIEGEFATCISLYHGYELLQQMGMRSLYLFLCGIMDGTRGMTRAKNQLNRNEDFVKLFDHLECLFAHTHNTNGISTIPKGHKVGEFFYSHPKLKKLEEVVVDHFKSWNEKNTAEKKCGETRVMIFSSFRDSVQEIAEMLIQHQPVIRVMTFVGHSSGKSMKGFTQKEQLEVVKKFRDGGYNTLVSTCVGEEGLDIGEVDLIICFDAQKSPIRLVQRMGRTGRKRQGRIVIILSEGREERTYNQSQSNKRSIYKAVSGNRKVLHFYQRSPRMIPDRITPKLHKMFITLPDYEPEKPSWNMQRKFSTFSYVNGMKQNNSKRDWSLSEEEFKLWTRFYRLRDSDEIKEITLPQIHFPSLQNEEFKPTQEPTIGVRQLSLSEWRVWQDHPLPTHQVDHSERCHHFINIMQMIEEMRYEEEECSYEMKIKSYLQMEDVNTTFNGSKIAGNYTSDKKSLSTEGANKGSSFLVTDYDEKYTEDFKQSCIKSSKIVFQKNKASEEIMKDQLDKDHNDNAIDFLYTEGNSNAENTFQADLPCDKMASDTDEVVACTIKENVVNQPYVLKDCQLKCSSFAGNFLDSGYISFSDEKSVEEDTCLGRRTSDQFYDCHSLTKEVLANVEQFLSYSPPPLSELSNLEYEITKNSTLNSVFLPYTEHYQNDKSTNLMLSSSENSQQNLKLNSLKLTSFHINHHSQKNCLYGASNDTICNESNDKNYDDKLHKDTKDENLVPNNSVQISFDPLRNLVKEKNPDVDNSELPKCSDQDESLLLFDDVNPEFNDVILSPLNNKHKPLCGSDKTALSEMPVITHFLISDELLLNNDSESQDQIICDDDNWKFHESLRVEHEEKLKNVEHVFDFSKDLFSVTFDLGFCSQDSDDEVFEFSSDKNKNKLVNDLPGSYIDNKETNDANYVSNQALLLEDNSESFMNRSTTILSSEEKHNSNIALLPIDTAKIKEVTSLGYSQFYFPVGEKAMSTPLSKSNAVSSFSKVGEDMPKTPSSTKKKVRLQSLNKALNSSFGSEPSPVKEKSCEKVNLHASCHFVEDEQLLTSSESDDEIFQRSKKTRRNVLESPEDQKNNEVASPVHAVKKRRILPNRSELSSGDESENFQKCHFNDVKGCKKTPKRSVKIPKRDSHLKHVARQFLDDEAELSQEDAEYASSDENDESENEQDSSILDFLNDETQLSQAINDSEMRAVYAKSLHSPLMNNKYKMVQKKHNNINIFSQIPEQDETYLEDSFCVAEEESFRSQSSDEEVCVDFNLITEDCFGNGNKKYKTRHAVKQMKTRQNCALSKRKFSRIVLPDDSSEEENNVKDKRCSSIVVKPSTVNKNEQQDHHLNFVPSGSLFQSKVHSNPIALQSQKQTPQSPLHVRDTVSEALDFKPLKHTKIRSPSPSFRTVESWKDSKKFPIQLKDCSNTEEASVAYSNSKPYLPGTHTSLSLPQEGKRTRILVDSREITSGSEVISSLRAVHGLEVDICSLNGCDYIVSNRMVVERKSQSEMLNSINKNKLIDQIQHLQSMFERICLIVEKDREKPGDTSKMFRRTKSYDSLLTALISAGIRILFSSCQEETADLLKELSLVEERKNVGIHVPAVVNSSKRDTLQFYLSIPNISYITALNMCHHFSSVSKMTNSAPQEISLYAQVTHQKAEEIYRYINHLFDMQMLPNSLNQGGLKSNV
ncbi:PREDICTED: Fanconi anemia group M protein [Elephantulus edwardii]|uniref:Fanconi anemia group M protein n=1 Tax=Elephantulus edwardii TaxID=28737 RepID=UPI0003F0E834|nr:PREDICTED: Fanconi anemia group M protein [Elephantulus edwardii]